jgi:prevent-host-death family protein
MSIVNIHEAKTHLSKLVEQVEQGETVVIARAGKPVARLVPLEQQVPRSRSGFLSGVFTTPEDFDTMASDEIVALFEGRE